MSIEDPLVLGGKFFDSRFILGSGKYSLDLVEAAVEHAGAQIITLALRRAQLDTEQIEAEMAAIAQTGLEEVLILTGESRTKSTVEYIGEACKIASRYFKNVGLEVYPMNSDEYAYLQECGADYVTVFQETYDARRYEELHLAGHKRVFPYRMEAQAARAG